MYTGRTDESYMYHFNQQLSQVVLHTYDYKSYKISLISKNRFFLVRFFPGSFSEVNKSVYNVSPWSNVSDVDPDEEWKSRMRVVRIILHS